MNLRAIQNDSIVMPDEASKDDYLTCPECGDDMTVVRQHQRQGSPVVRHFRHKVNRDCPGGESETHVKMKYTSKQTLKMTLANTTVTVEERFPDISRKADVAAKFDSPKPKLGNGIIVEAQYKNKDKDKLATSLDFLSQGYTIIWVDQDDFGDSYHTVDFEDINYPFPNLIPSAHQWQTPFYYEFRRDVRAEKYPIKSNLPQEYAEEIEHELKRSWKIGSSNYEFQVERELSTHNADRRCNDCNSNAEWYLLEFGVLSGYYCGDCHPALG